MYERHTIATGGLSFAEVKRGALNNPAAQTADDAPEFSACLRIGRPGF